jgi:hypothetical protein
MFDYVSTVLEVKMRIFGKCFEGHAACMSGGCHISDKNINLRIFELAVSACMFTRCRPSCLNSIIELTLRDYKALNNFRIAVVKIAHKANIAPLISR